MKLVLSWLESIVELDCTPGDLATHLSARGLLVDSIEELTWSGKNIVVGKALSVEKHPKADRLVVCEIDIGGSRLNIVCGATNVKPGMNVPVAVPGSTLPGGKQIDSAVLRGIRSEGMLCSPDELGLSSDADGILELSPGLSPGAMVCEALGLDDTVFEVDVPYDRADCLCVMGIAREIVAAGKARWKNTGEAAIPAANLEFPVTVDDSDGCPAYGAAIIDDVRITQSPVWMQRRLELSGIRPINNVVDITNYCLIERGQPIHAFDMGKLSGGITVRRAQKTEKLRTLDGIERTLSGEILVITDSARPVAIAGVIGGEESGVTESTSRVLIESAYFNPERVRTGSRVLGISSEASMRFSRGVDREGIIPSLSLVMRLLRDTGAGAPRDGICLVAQPAPARKNVLLDMGRLDSILGTSPGISETTSILESLGFSPVINGNVITASVPTHRCDIEEEADLVEDVARSMGYAKIPSVATNPAGLAARRNQVYEFVHRIRESMTSLGFAETLTACLVESEILSRMGFETENLVRILNPVSSSSAFLRPTLICGIVQTFARNLRRGVQSIRIFEAGKLFLKSPSGPPEERLTLCFGMTGDKLSASWDGFNRKVDIFDAKGVIEAICSELRIDVSQTFCYDRKGFSSTSSSYFEHRGERIGFVGEVDPSLLEASQSLYVGELDLERLAKLAAGVDTYIDPPRFPGIRRDISIVVDGLVAESALRNIIQHCGGGNLKEARLFDLYSGKGIPQGKKSLAYSFFFRSNERTLSDEEVSADVRRIVTALESEAGAVLRAGRS